MKSGKQVRERGRYRGKRRREIFTKACQVLAWVGLLMAIGAGGIEDTEPLWYCAASFGAGVAMFAGFGYLGDIFA